MSAIKKLAKDVVAAAARVGQAQTLVEKATSAYLEALDDDDCTIRDTSELMRGLDEAIMIKLRCEAIHAVLRFRLESRCWGEGMVEDLLFEAVLLEDPA